VNFALACDPFPTVVCAIYQQMLERNPCDPHTPDPGGLNQNVAALESGQYTVSLLVRGVAVSQEYRNDFIQRPGLSQNDVLNILYQKLLGRNANGLEMQAFLQANASPGAWPPSVSRFTQLVDQILNSSEYQTAFGSKQTGALSNVQTTESETTEFVPHPQGAHPVAACIDRCHTNGCGTLHITNASVICDGTTSHAMCGCTGPGWSSTPHADCK
jgi:hypothetical protein